MWKILSKLHSTGEKNRWHPKHVCKSCNNPRRKVFRVSKDLWREILSHNVFIDLNNDRFCSKCMEKVKKLDFPTKPALKADVEFIATSLKTFILGNCDTEKVSNHNDA